MFHPILDFLGKHVDAILSASIGLCGTLVALFIGHSLEQWRKRGKTEIEILSTDWTYHYEYDRRDDSTPNVSHVFCQFKLRIHNTYPIPKTFEVQEVNFFKQCSARHMPLLESLPVRVSQGSNRQGELFASAQPFEVAPKSFVRATFYCDAYPTGKKREVGEGETKLKGWQWARIRVLVSPNKIVTLWHKFPQDQAAKWPAPLPQRKFDLSE